MNNRRNVEMTGAELYEAILGKKTQNSAEGYPKLSNEFYYHGSSNKQAQARI